MPNSNKASSNSAFRFKFSLNLVIRRIEERLYYIAFRSVERSLEDILALSPRTHGNHATA